jgi:hypothetical protein
VWNVHRLQLPQYTFSNPVSKIQINDSSTEVNLFNDAVWAILYYLTSNTLENVNSESEIIKTEVVMGSFDTLLRTSLLADLCGFVLNRGGPDFAPGVFINQLWNYAESTSSAEWLHTSIKFQYLRHHVRNKLFLIKLFTLITKMAVRVCGTQFCCCPVFHARCVNVLTISAESEIMLFKWE